MTWIAGYADDLTYVPGDRVNVRTSTDADTVTVELVRLFNGDTNPAGPGADVRLVETVPSHTVPGQLQRVLGGSFGIIPAADSLAALQSFTVAAWVWPTAPTQGRTQGVISTADDSGNGFTLGIDGSGQLTFEAGGASITCNQPLKERQWTFISAVYDAGSGTVSVEGTSPAWPAQHVTASGSVSVTASAGPLYFATARVADSQGVGLFDGKIEAPIVLGRVSDATALTALQAGGRPAGAVGAWAFEDDTTGIRLMDRSPHGNHGEVTQMPTRAMTGHNWDGASDFHNAPDQFGAVHFHSDDIEDVGWSVTSTIELPADLPSGAYAARCTVNGDVEYVVFFVAPSHRPGVVRPDTAILFPTVSYMAYANDRMLDNAKLEEPGWLNLEIQRDRGDELLVAHREFGASIYDCHSDGSGISYSSWKRPVVNMRPDHRNWQTHAPRAFSCDLYIEHWLTQQDVEHDTLTDHLLHREGVDLLRRYRVIITGTHPEYWTTPMRDALEQWLDEGGRLMYLGGNGFYWVTSVHPTRPHVVEVRRGFGGTRTWESYAGETRHSTTLEPGGLWRYRGQDPNRIVGVGFSAQGFDVPSPGYELVPGIRESRAGWVFDGVENEVIGEYGLILDGACGDEIDRVDARWGTPPHTLVLATSKGRHTDFMQVTVEDIPVTNPNVSGVRSDKVRSDIVFMETGQGGAVFSVSSMNWAGSLSHKGYDNDVARVTTNVLNRFRDPEPFPSNLSAINGAGA
ncbi:LamG domain-containing protein [Nonomuraea basaltis]|uniref:LamG domain-containing protein n=1 Tax=Nonomuraea basaltis TaxID=2495887 RepID=UPI00110C4A31|nr:LamG domain-containing protein [Nonomuraea basaltis]TMR89582.1 LamG domain-containing protein [Nonomuraea basaltis]